MALIGNADATAPIPAVGGAVTEEPTVRLDNVHKSFNGF